MRNLITRSRERRELLTHLQIQVIETTTPLLHDVQEVCNELDVSYSFATKSLEGNLKYISCKGWVVQ